MHIVYIVFHNKHRSDAQLQKGKTLTIAYISMYTIKTGTVVYDVAEEHDIKEGIIFRTKNGNPVNRRNIWASMKRLCSKKETGKEHIRKIEKTGLVV